MQRRRNTDVIVETLALEGKRVIDVGCGDGSLVRLMAERGANVLGVECSPRQLAKARAAAPAPRTEIAEGVGQALPAPSGEADIVVFFNSLHHVPPEFMGKALEEAARVLRPGGMVYISEPMPQGPFFETCRPVDDETDVRDLAYKTLVYTPFLKLRQEMRYVHTVTMKNFAAFRDKIISANSEREARFDAISDELQALFNANGTRSEDGWSFDQPMRVNTLLKP